MVKKIQQAASVAAFATPRLTVVGIVLYGLYELAGSSSSELVQSVAALSSAAVTISYIVSAQGSQS